MTTKHCSGKRKITILKDRDDAFMVRGHLVEFMTKYLAPDATPGEYEVQFVESELGDFSFADGSLVSGEDSICGRGLKAVFGFTPKKNKRYALVANKINNKKVSGYKTVKVKDEYDGIMYEEKANVASYIA